MSKQILVLNGSPRRGGNTAALVGAFCEGAAQAGHQVARFDLHQLALHPCLGCLGGGKDPASPCVQKDDMEQIYAAYRQADLVVFASPMYYWAISAQLKTALDRLFAVTECDPGWNTPRKECCVLMAAEGESEENFEPVRLYYEGLARRLGWTDRGAVWAGGVLRTGDIQGRPALDEARALGASL